MPTAATKKIGSYMPQQAKMSGEKPESVTKMPEGVETPMWGVLPVTSGVAAKGFVYLLDEPEGKPARLWIDGNGNGDLTDDAAAEWDGKKNPGRDGNEYTMYVGGGMVDIGEKGSPMMVHLSMYRFDPKEPGRVALKDVLLYYRDYAYEGTMTLGGKAYPVLLSDDMASGDFRGKSDGGEKGSGVRLLVDVNGNGKFDSRGESYDVRKPFNLGGTTYKIADLGRTGGTFKVAVSDEKVAEIPPPPDHGVGKVITAFEAKSTEGKTVRFPGDYKGKVVLVDFWATWCGPCMAEMPNVVEVYKEFHPKGFEILGVSLDNEKSIEKMPEVMKDQEMTWTQIADGKGWMAAIAQEYVVNSIPATYLVDGTTGKILGVRLRGEALKTAVENALKAKNEN